MNTFSDILFFVFICLVLLIFSSYFFHYQEEFIELLRYFIIVSGITELIIGIISLIIEYSFVVGGYRIYHGRTFWIFFREILTFLILSAVYFLERFLIGELSIKL